MLSSNTAQTPFRSWPWSSFLSHIDRLELNTINDDASPRFSGIKLAQRHEDSADLTTGLCILLSEDPAIVLKLSAEFGPIQPQTSSNLSLVHTQAIARRNTIQ